MSVACFLSGSVERMQLAGNTNELTRQHNAAYHLKHRDAGRDSPITTRFDKNPQLESPERPLSPNHGIKQRNLVFRNGCQPTRAMSPSRGNSTRHWLSEARRIRGGKNPAAFGVVRSDADSFPPLSVGAVLVGTACRGSPCCTDFCLAFTESVAR